MGELIDFDFYDLTLLVKAVTFLAALAVISGWRPKAAPITLIAAVSAILIFGIIYRLFPFLGFDYRIFWMTGHDVLTGQDPYAPERFSGHPFLHPPTALPLFCLFAALPFPPSFVAWTAANLLVCAVLVACAQQVLLDQEDAVDGRTLKPHGAWKQPPLVLVGLTAALATSGASLLTIYLGQLGILAAAGLLAALADQARGRLVWAGVWLAATTVKVATMLPFLLLFTRKQDRPAWVSLAAATLVLCLATGGPGKLPGRMVATLQAIRQLEAPGVVNDYSFEGPRHENIVGFQHALYRLGLRDRQVIRAGQYLALLVLGVWVARLIALRKLGRAAACSLTALYASVFLYHRTYDMAILVLPLVYGTGRARSERGKARWLFAGCALAVLLVLYVDIDFLRWVFGVSLSWGAWGRLLQALVLPYATWSVLVAMVCLVLGERWARSPSAVTAGGESPGAAPTAPEPSPPRPGARLAPGCL